MYKFFSLILILLISSCASNTSDDKSKDQSSFNNSDSTLSIITWNLNYFFDNNISNTIDDKTQYQRVLNSLKTFKADIIAVQEISNHSKFAELSSDLGNYSAKISASKYNNPSQSIGIIYNKDELELKSDRILSTIASNSSRPPLLCELISKRNKLSYYVIAIHAKAFSDLSSYNKRKNFSISLKSYIDTNLSDKNVILIGDYNDKLLQSITTNQNSPYKNFMDDTNNYFAISSLHSTEASHRLGSVIDNILVSNELKKYYKNNSFNILQNELNKLYKDYLSTVSDHYPVFASIKY